MAELLNKNCLYCGKTFQDYHGTKKYCKPKCTYEAQKERNRSKMKQRHCKNCGKSIGTNRVYCDKKCRMIDYNKTQAIQNQKIRDEMEANRYREKLTREGEILAIGDMKRGYSLNKILSEFKASYAEGVYNYHKTRLQIMELYQQYGG